MKPTGAAPRISGDPSGAPPKAQRGVAAVEIAAALLDVLHKARMPLGVSAVAEASGFAPARVHHYLVSLAKTGLVRKEGTPARYGLGPFAIQLGLTAVDRLEAQHYCAPYLRRVSMQTREASFFSVWSDAGPMIVRWEQGSRPLTVYARLGTLMPLLRSATGDVYCAWGPQPTLEKVVARELLQFAPQQRAKEREALRRRTEAARRERCSATRGAMLPDVSAVAAPVHGKEGHLAGAITVLGLMRGFDVLADGPIARSVRQVSAELSVKLGYRGVADPGR